MNKITDAYNKGANREQHTGRRLSLQRAAHIAGGLVTKLGEAEQRGMERRNAAAVDAAKNAAQGPNKLALSVIDQVSQLHVEGASTSEVEAAAVTRMWPARYTDSATKAEHLQWSARLQIGANTDPSRTIGNEPILTGHTIPLMVGDKAIDVHNVSIVSQAALNPRDEITGVTTDLYINSTSAEAHAGLEKNPEGSLRLRIDSNGGQFAWELGPYVAPKDVPVQTNINDFLSSVSVAVAETADMYRSTHHDL
jgi:hypothetical protein